jgi:hypothetical protein
LSEREWEGGKMHEGKKENYRMRIRVKDRERKKEKKEKSREKDTEWVGGKDRKAGQKEKRKRNYG